MPAASVAAELSKIVPVPRRPEHEYLDPLDTVWIRAAGRMGLAIVYTNDAYAHYDGRGTLAVGSARNLDPDDCVAQLIFHEICHWLVEGLDSFHKVNWGLCNTSLRDLDREYASLRVQAALSAPYGLRRFLANTTDHRAYYDALPEDPLALSDDGSTELAELALQRAKDGPWAPTLQLALEATARIAAAVAPFAEPPSLYCTVEAPASRERGAASALPASSSGSGLRAPVEGFGRAFGDQVADCK